MERFRKKTQMSQIDEPPEPSLQYPNYLDPETRSSDPQSDVREAFLYNRGAVVGLR